MTKHLEIKTVEYKGINIIVQINYDTGQAAMVTKHITGFTPKQWQFSHRGLEYMDGWLDIIMAMRNAVIDIKKELEQDLAEKSAFKKQGEISRMKMVHKAVKAMSKVRKEDLHFSSVNKNKNANKNR